MFLAKRGFFVCLLAFWNLYMNEKNREQNNYDSMFFQYVLILDVLLRLRVVLFGNMKTFFVSIQRNKKRRGKKDDT